MKILITGLVSFAAAALNLQPAAWTINPTKNKTMSMTITQAERDSAIMLLTATESGVYESIKQMNASQLQYKPSPEKWNAEECIKHIAASEETFWKMIEQSLKQSANPEERKGIKFTDQQLVNAVEDRSHKSKTFSDLEPSNSSYKSIGDALGSFKTNRQKLIAFVKSTQDDLRNHVSVLPIGTFDAYQFILLIAAHSNRHTQQIIELKSEPGFPG